MRKFEEGSKCMERGKKRREIKTYVNENVDTVKPQLYGYAFRTRCEK